MLYNQRRYRSIVPLQVLIKLNLKYEDNALFNHEKQSLKNFLKSYTDSNRKTFLIVVYKEKSRLFIFRNNVLVMVDSHASPPHGARILYVTIENIDLLIEETFGSELNKSDLVYIAEIELIQDV